MNSHTPQQPRRIELRPMTDAQYEVFRARLIESYARDKAIANGTSLEVAHQVAVESFARHLPQGVSTPGHWLYAVHALEPEAGSKRGPDAGPEAGPKGASGARVGWVWVGEMKSQGTRQFYIMDIVVEPELRGQGYGSAILLELERLAKSLGFSQMGLHAFGHNPGAIRLYERHGYAITDVWMAKKV